MSFADVEARTNASVFKALVNAIATYTPDVGDPVSFDIVFDKAGVVDPLGIATGQPLFQMPSAAFAALEEGMRLMIRSKVAGASDVGYQVRSVLPLDEGLRQRVTLAEL